MFVLVVTGKKELADDKAVLLSNAHHQLHLLKLAVSCSLQDWGKCSLLFLFMNAPAINIISI